MRKTPARIAALALFVGVAVAGAYGLKVQLGLVPMRVMGPRLQWGLPIASVATAMAWIVARSIWPPAEGTPLVRRLIRDAGLLIGCALIAATFLSLLAEPMY